jgi:hypothetical protein
VFTRSGGVWSQQGSKLVGTGAVNPAEQGFSLALSCNTTIVGGPQDNTQQGAAWAFVAPPTSTHDFNGGCLSDILWRDNSGSVAIWLMNGPSVLQSGTLGAVDSNWAIAETGDFNGTARLTFSGAIRTPTIRTIRTTGWW